MSSRDPEIAHDLEIFRHRLNSIVEEMGIVLQRTAYSTNIKVRRDHTCALFDGELNHIAQHEIAPQHIGSLSTIVPRIMDGRKARLAPGDGILINDPAEGCMHLPDLILISPIFREGEIVGYVANSAHHVDVGGVTPGSFPTDNTEVYAEGLIIPGVKAVEGWEFDEDVVAIFQRNVRDAEMRLGDLNAQLGANRIGDERYLKLLGEYGRAHVESQIEQLLEYTERRVRTALEELPDGTYEAEDYMDNDGVVDEKRRLKLTLSVSGDGMTIDFTGTAAQNPGPLNAPQSVVLSGVLYSVMALLGADIPKNQGFYRPFEFVLPEGTMVNPDGNAPVAGGWELSMRAAELVIAAMADAIPDQVIAATKGIVCNIAFGGTDPRQGDKEYVFYETVGGGYGARPTKDGLDGVQSHHQDTANSPVEEIERDHPVRITRYEFREGSAGAGTYRGGLGLRREYEFTGHEPTFSILADRVKSAPWGLFGGKDGAPARFVVNPDGDEPRELPSKATITLEEGNVLSVQTPGGGGYGDPLERDPAAVLADVVNGKVSEREARTEYGVTVDAEQRAVDEEATEALREEMRNARGGSDGDEDGDGNGNGKREREGKEGREEDN